jgi:hypothetical protein
LESLPSGIVRLSAYAGTPDQYETYITSEASKALQDYWTTRGELKPDAFAFVGAKGRSYQGAGLEMVLKRLKQRAGLTGFKSVHAYRKWFKTRAEMGVKSLVVETLLGHSTGLSMNYLRFTDAELEQEYLKAAPFLTVSPEYALKGRLDQEKERNDTLEWRLSFLELQLLQIKTQIAGLPVAPALGGAGGGLLRRTRPPLWGAERVACQQRDIHGNRHYDAPSLVHHDGNRHYDAPSLVHIKRKPARLLEPDHHLGIDAFRGLERDRATARRGHRRVGKAFQYLEQDAGSLPGLLSICQYYGLEPVQSIRLPRLLPSVHRFVRWTLRSRQPFCSGGPTSGR